MKKYLPFIALLMLSINVCFSQTVSRNIKTAEYRALQKKLCTGWNTWYNHSFMSHVLLPEGFSINICVARPGLWETGFLRENYKGSKSLPRPEEVKPGLRSDDGSYTSVEVKFKEEVIQVQSAVDGDDQLILVTPAKPSKNQLVIEAGLPWDRKGMIGVEENMLSGRFPHRTISVHTTELPVKDGYVVSYNPHLTVPLLKEVGIYTGKVRTLSEIKNIIDKNRAVQQKRIDSYGKLSEAFKAMQTILAWNTIYDAPNIRAITPVSRFWNHSWGGFVLFDWDTYFASYMCSMFNKELAYANAIEITKTITPDGFIPNYQAPFGVTSWDRSQPPVGSLIIYEIYKRYNEKWLLEEVYDELLSWNRWWPKTRDVGGYLAFGSNNVPDSLRTIEKHNMQAAKYESLDNSPLYDDVPFNPVTHTMDLADVSLMSYYVMDCDALSKIAVVLGKKSDISELKERSAKYGKRLATMWDEEEGIFLNKRLDTGEKSHRIAPNNFYPMLAKVATQQQAEIMIKKHYFNPDKFYGEFVMPSISRDDSAFKDNSYWRGRIWAPMNFLVYLGMRNYNLPEARKDLIAKSMSLLMKSWNENGAVFENYNSVTGRG
ncbi:MAG: trehalase family glycosidase, partial [Mariniphaga sp.]